VDGPQSRSGHGGKERNARPYREKDTGRSLTELVSKGQENPCRPQHQGRDTDEYPEFTGCRLNLHKNISLTNVEIFMYDAIKKNLTHFQKGNGRNSSANRKKRLNHENCSGEVRTVHPKPVIQLYFCPGNQIYALSLYQFQRNLVQDRKIAASTNTVIY
jgi:hypothetical protein